MRFDLTEELNLAAAALGLNGDEVVHLEITQSRAGSGIRYTIARGGSEPSGWIRLGAGPLFEDALEAARRKAVIDHARDRKGAHRR